MRRNLVLVGALGVVLAATVAGAQGGMMNGSSGMQGGGGMLVVADDGSVLVTQMGMGMMGGGLALQRSLVDLATDGSVRWTKTFTDGWPMLPVTQGDLVVFALVDAWWMGSGTGDMGNPGGMTGGSGGNDQVTLVGLALATGAERWRVTLAGDMASMAQFAPDGNRLYVTVLNVNSAGTMGSTSMMQGTAAGTGGVMSSTVEALDRNGNVLWTKDLGSTGGMGGN